MTGQAIRAKKPKAKSAGGQKIAADAAAKTMNVLVVGVGGQGVIMISKVLALLCQSQGYEVKQSEVHGMAKRGGSVFSHVRFGEKIWSPTIPMGEADILVALEWAEGLRWLPYLRPDSGVFIADTQRIVPPFSCRDRKYGAALAYAKETAAEIIEKVFAGYALDAGGMAEDLGSARAANTILLGALSSSLDFTLEDWLGILGKFVPKGTEKVNEQAFIRGRQWAENVKANPAAFLEQNGPVARPAVAHTMLADDMKIRLEITEAWCKSCDICVKLCPERCLELNELQIVRLKDEDACTGCRLCEWLCPDFAIAVHREPQANGRLDAR